MVPSQKSPLSAKNNLATWIRKCQQMPKAVVFFIQRDIISMECLKKKQNREDISDRQLDWK